MAEEVGQQAPAASNKPSVLIIGGLGMVIDAAYLESQWLTAPCSALAGYIGRFLALYIHENNLASEVRLVDKVLPQLAWLAPEFNEACSADKFVQADASRERKSAYWLITLCRTMI